MQERERGGHVVGGPLLDDVGVVQFSIGHVFVLMFFGVFGVMFVR
jgi:hypothetical protein